MIELFFLGCPGAVVFLHSVNFLFHAFSSHIVFCFIRREKRVLKKGSDENAKAVDPLNPLQGIGSPMTKSRVKKMQVALTLFIIECQAKETMKVSSGQKQGLSSFGIGVLLKEELVQPRGQYYNQHSDIASCQFCLRRFCNSQAKTMEGSVWRRRVKK